MSQEAPWIEGSLARQDGGAREATLTALRTAIAGRAGGATGTPQAVPTGFPALDLALGGGLDGAALNEVFVAAAGSGALEALLPALLNAGSRRRLLAWIHPDRAPYPPALAQKGFDLRRWVVVRPKSEDDHQWALDQALRSGACDAVLAFAGDLHDRVLRRLQLAARESGTLGLLIRPQALAMRPSPAAVRLAAEPVPARDPRRRRVRFAILRGQGPAAFGAALAGLPIDVEWSRDPLDGAASS